MTQDIFPGIVAVIIAISVVICYCFDRWCEHREIMADKKAYKEEDKP